MINEVWFSIHFMSTHASYLLQIEVWFSILSVQSLRGGTTSSLYAPSYGCTTS